MLALRGLEHLQEVGQADPFAAFPCALAHLAGGIAGVGLAFQISGLAGGQVCGKQACSAIAIRAAVKDMDFEHSGLLSGFCQAVESKSPPQTQRTESEAGLDRPYRWLRMAGDTEACVKRNRVPPSPGDWAVPYGVTSSYGVGYSIVVHPLCSL